MIIEKLHAGNAEPRRGDIIGNRPVMVVGQKDTPAAKIGAKANSGKEFTFYGFSLSTGKGVSLSQ